MRNTTNVIITMSIDELRTVCRVQQHNLTEKKTGRRPALTGTTASHTETTTNRGGMKYYSMAAFKGKERGYIMKATFNNFEIMAIYTGSKPAPGGGKMPENWNHHRITVKNTDNGKRTGFDFWASIAKPELSTEYDILNAFRCFVDDALSGDMDFSEFCGEFGYDEDSRTAERTWKACKRSADKLSRVYDGDLYELINSLEDWA